MDIVCVLKDMHGMECNVVFNLISFHQLFLFNNFFLATCPQGWVSNQGQCYYYSTYATTWTAANSFCNGLGAYLTLPSNNFEMTFYYTNRALVNNNWFWIGIYTCKLISSSVTINT